MACVLWTYLSVQSHLELCGKGQLGLRDYTDSGMAFLRYGGHDKSELFGLDVYTQINPNHSVVALCPPYLKMAYGALLKRVVFRT